MRLLSFCCALCLVLAAPPAATGKAPKKARATTARATAAKPRPAKAAAKRPARGGRKGRRGKAADKPGDKTAPKTAPKIAPKTAAKTASVKAPEDRDPKAAADGPQQASDKRAESAEDASGPQPGDDSLAETPARAAATFAASSKKLKKKGGELLAKAIERLRGVGGWNIDPANKAQIKKAVQRLEQERKTIDEAAKLLGKGFHHEQLSLQLEVKAARVRELVGGAKTDVSAQTARLHDLGMGEPQKGMVSRVKAVGLLIDALIHYIKGELAQAIILTDESIKTNDKVGLAHAFQGSFYYLTHNRARAVEAWERALKLEPKNEAVKRALAAIRGDG